MSNAYKEAYKKALRNNDPDPHQAALDAIEEDTETPSSYVKRKDLTDEEANFICHGDPYPCVTSH